MDWRRRTFLLVEIFLLAGLSRSIPTTLEGPFKPVTIPFDSSLRRGSQDLPTDDPRLQRTRPHGFPEQIKLALSHHGSMWVSWVSGDYQIGDNVVPLDPSTTKSFVLYGTSTHNYNFLAEGSVVVYSQLYPFVGLLNYTSGFNHHVLLDGLKASTTYYYRCGSSLERLSEELSFTTLDDRGYPARIAVVGDLGLTYNSSATVDHVIRNDPSLLLMVGDLTYSDQYITNGTGSPCFSCAFPDAPIRETYQPHWDHWGRFMEPLTAKVPMMVIEGNHEIEPQALGKTFESYKARFSVPPGSNSSLYYSFDVGGIHFLMLGGYIDYNRTGAQFAWLKDDLQRVNRLLTPWIVAAWHPPWYNSYSSHYREVECMRLEMEELLYNAGVDIVINGHVHAYERTNRVYNYELDPCAPLYIVVGDGGNVERVDTEHADDPGRCPKPEDNVPQFGGVCAQNFSTGPAANQFCWGRQPDWSALRDGSFGHGVLEVKNNTHALWTWYRNQDVYGDSHLGDQIYIVKSPQCQNYPAFQADERSGGNSGSPSRILGALAILLLL
ncbi:purple acid phosphatase 23 [Selaginella moellendorffii]|uniref:purple acid phosphatase 23 n=1 Tax=Selaginella moellendorffii TaxID=88036 RepID=UPI000D1CFD5D|nr:purple acid phosphatase 23 [Selaginella moellendorffii]|eukprot:XP_024519500.1 purple acid phosphatase 23 [Selaginella moellendorffii]